MNYLVDTHVFIWFISNGRKLSETAKHILENKKYNIFVSSISFWEIALKFSLGKLEIINFDPEMLPELAVEAGFKILPLSAAESSTYHKLNLSAHKGPFDRMLIWQAIRNEMIFISKDRNAAQYKTSGLKIIW